MTKILSPLQNTDGVIEGYCFYCEGCGHAHCVQTREPNSFNGKAWGFNGNVDAPTFTPSILARYPANPNAIEGFEEWLTERVCHSYVTDGKIQYLDDCSHALAGQTVPLGEFKYYEGDGDD